MSYINKKQVFSDVLFARISSRQIISRFPLPNRSETPYNRPSLATGQGMPIRLR
jgi:hypothetical protein